MSNLSQLVLILSAKYKILNQFALLGLFPHSYTLKTNVLIAVLSQAELNSLYKQVGIHPYVIILGST